jgi:hypothetical protein
MPDRFHPSAAARAFFEQYLALPERVFMEVNGLLLSDRRSPIAEIVLNLQADVLAKAAHGMAGMPGDSNSMRDFTWCCLLESGTSESDIARMFNLPDPKKKGRKKVESAIRRFRKWKAERDRIQAQLKEERGW